MSVSVIVPARDAARTLPATLTALARQKLETAYQVIVVDDGSDDETAEIAERSEIVDQVIRREGGAGAGAARNAGVAASAAPMVAFTDADCRPSPDWLAKGVRALHRADLVQGSVHPPAEVTVGPYDRVVAVHSEYGLYETANLFVTRDIFDRVGGFEDWVTSYGQRPFGEDAWFAWQARRAGARTAFAADAVVRHGVDRRSALEYVRERRRLRHFPALAARIPELRDGFFYRRWFFSSRSAALDLAIAGGVAAVATHRRALLALTVPYVVIAVRSARRGGRRRLALVAAADAAADAVGLVALAGGSAAARTLLL